MLKSSNPVLNPNTFGNQYSRVIGGPSSMTMNGTVNKTVILLFLVILSAIYPWYAIHSNPQLTKILMYTGLIGGFIFALITTFKPNISPYTAPMYALLEGLALGGISAIYDLRFQGIALQALMLTVAVLFLMLFLYRTKIIQVTEKFRLGVLCATGAIGLLYLVSFILGFFGITLSFMSDSSWLSIGISLVIVGVAALNLALNFDIIEQGVNSGAPKYMEWYGAFGLLVTLVWLYIEILKLLSKLKSRD